MQIPGDRHVSTVTFYIRYAETDQMGIVHHSNYFVYAEELRSQYARDFDASYADFETQAGLALAVSEVNFRYLSPALYGQRISIKGWVIEAKSRRLTFGYHMLNPDTDTLHVTGTSNHICVDRDGRVRRIPETWLRLWGVENT
jgi:acyl-CoA thioester hydrolase